MAKGVEKGVFPSTDPMGIFAEVQKKVICQSSCKELTAPSLSRKIPSSAPPKKSHLPHSGPFPRGSLIVAHAFRQGRENKVARWQDRRGLHLEGLWLLLFRKEKRWSRKAKKQCLTTTFRPGTLNVLLSSDCSVNRLRFWRRGRSQFQSRPPRPSKSSALSFPPSLTTPETRPAWLRVRDALVMARAVCPVKALGILAQTLSTRWAWVVTGLPMLLPRPRVQTTELGCDSAGTLQISQTPDAPL